MRFRHAIPFLLCALIVALAIALPPRLSELQDEALLGEMHYEKTVEVSAAQASELDVVQKLALINRYMQGEKGIMSTEYTQPLNTVLDEESVRDTCLTELGKLSELNLVPDLIPRLFEVADSFGYTIVTYAEMQSPAHYVRLWQINIMADQSNLSLELDDETGKIYQINMRGENQTAVLDVRKIFPDAWGDYLGIELSDMTYENDMLVAYAKADPSVFYGISIMTAETTNTFYNHLTSRRFRNCAVKRHTHWNTTLPWCSS